MRPELCHVVLFSNAAETHGQRLEGLGLVESFRRDHPAQGTSNICFCFANAYLELLMVTGETVFDRDVLARTGIHKRFDTPGASPFGFAIRRGGVMPFPTWDYQPPYLPPGVAIPVDTGSDDWRQPLLFGSPGSRRPDQWTDGRAGALQQAARLDEIVGLSLTQPDAPSDALSCLAGLGLLTVRTLVDSPPKLGLTISSPGQASRTLWLPDMTIE